MARLSWFPFTGMNGALARSDCTLKLPVVASNQAFHCVWTAPVATASPVNTWRSGACAAIASSIFANVVGSFRLSPITAKRMASLDPSAGAVVSGYTSLQTPAPPTL